MAITKKCPSCMTEKDVSEFGKNKQHKDGLSWYCKPCNRAKLAVHREENKEKIRERKKKFHSENKEKISIYRKEWHKSNRSAQLDKLKKYAEENKDRIKEYKRAYLQENREKEKERKNLWAELNRGIYRASKVRRRAGKLKATPAWANKESILKIYESAVTRSKMDGVKYHVDHIVPLQSPIVCGLHCESNLRILSARENIQKSNQYWPDMP